MQSWGLSSGDPGYIDPADPGALNPADSRYVRSDLAPVPAYYDRIRAEAETRLSRTTSTRSGAGPASERLPGDQHGLSRGGGRSVSGRRV